MRGRIIEQPAPLYETMDSSQPVLVLLPIGEEVQVLKALHGRRWMLVQYQGRTAYLPGETRLFRVLRMELVVPQADVFGEPNAQAVPRYAYRKGDRFWCVDDALAADGTRWVAVRDRLGRSGYLPGKTKVHVLPDDLRTLARNSLKYGVLWSLLGGVVLLLAWNLNTPGGVYWLSGAALLFGLWQCALAAWQHAQARKDDTL